MCVCVCGSAGGGLALSVITISDWVRAKVCDISQPLTHSVAVGAHLRVILFGSPLLHRFPGRFGAAVFHMQGVSVDGCCSETSRALSFLLLRSSPTLFALESLSF